MGFLSTVYQIGRRLMPKPMTHAQLVEALEALLAHVRAHNSFEGSFEYLMPQPAEKHQLVVVTMPDEVLCCVTCGVGHRDLATLQRIHEGDPQTTADGQRTDFMVRASYRVGNSMGQGGMRLIGVIE